MSEHIKIVCRRAVQPPPPLEGSPAINFGLVADISDVEVEINGKPFTNIRSIKWQVREKEPATATIEFYDVELDVEGQLSPEEPAP